MDNFVIAIEKEYTIDDIALAINDNETAFDLIVAVDEQIEDWEFTLSVTKQFLELLNLYEEYVCDFNDIPQEISDLLKSCYKRMVFLEKQNG